MYDHSNNGKHLVRCVDPLIDTMPKLFGKRRKVKEAPDAPWRKYPFRMYVTRRMVSIEQHNALKNDWQLKLLRKKWIDMLEARVANGKRRGVGTTALLVEQNARGDVSRRCDYLLQKAGLPLIY